jgi:hypothetical protein
MMQNDVEQRMSSFGTCGLAGGEGAAGARTSSRPRHRAAAAAAQLLTASANWSVGAETMDHNLTSSRRWSAPRQLRLLRLLVLPLAVLLLLLCAVGDVSAASTPASSAGSASSSASSELHTAIAIMDFPRLQQLLADPQAYPIERTADYAPSAAEAVKQAGGFSSQCDGCTPLLLASAVGCVEIAEELLAAGADTEATDATDGSTALLVAAAGGFEDVVGALLAAGADAAATDAAGRTAAVLAETTTNDDYRADYAMVMRRISMGSSAEQAAHNSLEL